MRESVSPSTLELLAWISSRPRTYAEAIEAWRSSCPRQPVWEDAFIGGLLQVVRGGQSKGDSQVALTELGEATLEAGSASHST